MVKNSDDWERHIPMMVQDSVTLADGTASSVLVDVPRIHKIYRQSLRWEQGHSEFNSSGSSNGSNQNDDSSSRRKYAGLVQKVAGINGFSRKTIDAVVNLSDRSLDLLRWNTDFIVARRDDYSGLMGALQEEGLVVPFEPVREFNAEDTIASMLYVADSQVKSAEKEIVRAMCLALMYKN